MNGFIVMLSVVILATAGQILMKKGMSKFKSLDLKKTLSQFFKIVFQPLVLVGIIVSVVAAAFMLLALSSLNVSYAYPLVSGTYVLTALFALIFLKEKISALRWGGILLIVLGSILIIFASL